MMNPTEEELDQTDSLVPTVEPLSPARPALADLPAFRAARETLVQLDRLRQESSDHILDLAAAREDLLSGTLSLGAAFHEPRKKARRAHVQAARSSFSAAVVRLLLHAGAPAPTPWAELVRKVELDIMVGLDSLYDHGPLICGAS